MRARAQPPPPPPPPPLRHPLRQQRFNLPLGFHTAKIPVAWPCLQVCWHAGKRTARLPPSGPSLPPYSSPPHLHRPSPNARALPMACVPMILATSSPVAPSAVRTRCFSLLRLPSLLVQPPPQNTTTALLLCVTACVYAHAAFHFCAFPPPYSAPPFPFAFREIQQWLSSMSRPKILLHPSISA